PYTQFYSGGYLNSPTATTPIDAAALNALETQYTEAINSYGPDEFSAGFVQTGLACSGTVGGTTLTMAAGVAYLLQTDGTFRRRVLALTTKTTVTASATYYLDLNPDGTLSWATSHSGVSHYLPLCQVTTDGSGNIATVVDERVTVQFWSPSAAGSVVLPPIGGITLSAAVAAPSVVGMSAGAQSGSGLGTGVYNYYVTFGWDGGETLPSAAVSVTTTGGNNKVALSGIPTSSDARVTWRRIYRTAVGGVSNPYYVATIADNTTTTYTDTYADTSIVNNNQGRVPPKYATAGGMLRGGYPWSATAAPAAVANPARSTNVTFGSAELLYGDTATSALFNGTSSYLACYGSNYPQYSFNSGVATIEAVIKLSAYPGTTGVVAMLGTYTAGKYLAILINSSGQVYAGNGSVSTATSSALGLVNTHHVAAHYDGVYIRCFLDGALVGTTTPTSITYTYTTGYGLAVGATNAGSPSLFLSARVARVAVYNYGLAPSQIAQHSALALSGVGSGSETYDQAVADDSPLYYWRLADAAGSTKAADATRYQTILTADGQLQTSVGVSLDRGQITTDGYGNLVVGGLIWAPT
ncbi:MAG: hypothetical protein IVW57_16815, partial [Ktedonobacterales bacterium]|nr:hypothetical protein [Ktedonobacterales bacterium]